MVLNQFYVPTFGDPERDNTRQENVEYERIRGYHAIVGKLLVRERESKTL